VVAERITGPQKAAIFLFAIGEELASEIVKKLDEEEIKRLGGSMSQLFSITPKMLDSVFTEFNELASSINRSIPIGPAGSSQFIKNILTKAGEEGRAKTLLEEMQEEGKWNLFQRIKQLDPKTLANFIKNEHPQTISIILAHLDAAQSAAVLEDLPSPLQIEVVYRIAELEKVPPAILEEIDQVLQKEISLVENMEGRKVGGIGSVAEILNQVDGSTETSILKGIEEQKQGLADEIRKLMFVFEDLLQVDDRGIMAILKEVTNEVLQVALKTASEELKEKIFKNMSERAAQMMKEDLEVMAPVRLKDVETAQQSIIKAAKKLESEGKIVLAGKGKEEVFV
jgi:flagellar motor switch protein FliG